MLPAECKNAKRKQLLTQPLEHTPRRANKKVGRVGKTFFTFFHGPMNSWWDLPNIWDHKLIRTAASHLLFLPKKSARKKSAGWSPRRYVFLSPDVIFFEPFFPKASLMLGFSFSCLRRGNDRNPALKSFHVNLLDGWTWSVLETASQVYRLTLESKRLKGNIAVCVALVCWEITLPTGQKPEVRLLSATADTSKSTWQQKRFASVEAGP